MLVFFIYDAYSATIFNREDKSIPGYEKHELGRSVVDLNPLHLSRELRYVENKLKRIGYRDKPRTRKRVREAVAKGLRTKDHFCIDI